MAACQGGRLVVHFTNRKNAPFLFFPHASGRHLRKDTEYRRTEFTRRRRVSLEGHPFFIVAPEDLVISKLDWARDTRSEVQLADARNLLRSVPGLDRPYLERWTARLGLQALYRDVLE